jgi:hypothetical protein
MFWKIWDDEMIIAEVGNNVLPFEVTAKETVEQDDCCRGTVIVRLEEKVL